MSSSQNGLLPPRDMEAGPSKRDTGSDEDDDPLSDPFVISQTKHESLKSLKRWRQAALVLNASRRFRYTLDLKKEEEKENRRRMIRSHAQVIRAALLFKLAAEQDIDTIAPPPTSSGDYGIELEQLASMTRDHNFSALEQYGGVKGLSDLLKTNIAFGISGDDTDLSKRRNSFGSNTYPLKKGRSFLKFLWEAWQDLTLIILIVAAAASLALGIKTEGVEEGWYDGASIAFAVILVIIVTAISDYRQSLQFQNLNKEKRNIQIEVPADGVLVTGHSLAIDESSMTGESKTVRKDQKSPFLMSGCKVADGVGTMLVRLNGVATLIGIVGLTVAGLVLAVLLGRYVEEDNYFIFFTGNTTESDGRPQFVKGHTSIGDAVDGVIKIITIAVTIVVVAVPEGLPLAVTLTLAYSMRKMMVDKALAKGMRVVEAYAGRKKIDPADDTSQIHPAVVSLLSEGVAQNTTGNVFVPKDGGDVEVTGSPTEKAILSWAVKLGMKFDIARSETTVLHVFPFNSEKKRGGVALKRVLLIGKGIVLGTWVRLAADFFKEAVDEMAARSLRCVAIAYRLYEIDKVPSDEESLDQWVLPEDDLVLLAIVGIQDPCRPSVKNAVKVCKEAGIKVACYIS
ncbi:hypothetical protein Patl1_34906 [Pistacia atlantica]|uniref:Uncharacterized protein n=1 Tax=Pistacia atlantica TaxID=434234 RepID=A0ACC0ZR20_9ROSI|nr:hypothetical protein Patl1_34906 [Pistacia atlantica]